MQDRFERQAELVPRDRITDLTVDVIGVGAIGRQVALQLATLGVRRMRLIDFDTVEPTNITTQGYFTSDLGQPKVAATGQQVGRVDSDIELTLVCDRYRSTLGCSQAVFCCVDSISARAAIWRSVQDGCRFWCDGRMLGEVIRVLTVVGSQGREEYGRSLFPQAEAQRGSCTGHGTIYTASIAAGLMVHQFTRSLRTNPTDAELTLNLLASEMSLGARWPSPTVSQP